MNCPRCGAGPLDPATLYIHARVHQRRPGDLLGLGQLPFALMPDVGAMLTEFGEELLTWLMRHQIAGDVGCLTGECLHEHESQCRTWLLKEFLETKHD